MALINANSSLRIPDKLALSQSSLVTQAVFALSLLIIRQVEL